MLLLIHDKAYCTAPAKGGKLLPSAAEREHTVPSVMDVPDKHALSKVLVSKHLRLDTKMRRQSVFINRGPRAPVNQPNGWTSHTDLVLYQRPPRSPRSSTGDWEIQLTNQMAGPPTLICSRTSVRTRSPRRQCSEAAWCSNEQGYPAGLPSSRCASIHSTAHSYHPHGVLLSPSGQMSGL